MKSENYTEYRHRCKIIFGTILRKKPNAEPLSNAQLHFLMQNWFYHLQDEGITEKEEKDAQRHFNAWAKKTGIEKNRTILLNLESETPKKTQGNEPIPQPLNN